MTLNPLSFLESAERPNLLMAILYVFDEGGKQADHPVVAFREYARLNHNWIGSTTNGKNSFVTMG